MKYIKSIKISLLIIFIFFCTFCSGYTMGSSFVFAYSTTDEWTQVTTNAQLVEAFKYYCKSRDLTIDGSIADGVTQFTTNTFYGLCKTLGIDMTALQAQIKYQTDSNVGIRFLFSSVGIDAFNRIFAQFLQDNNLSVGDSTNKSLYDGYYYGGSLVWIVSKIGYDSIYSNLVLQSGTPYNGYTGDYCASVLGNNATAALNVVNDTITIQKKSGSFNGKYGDYVCLKNSFVYTIYSYSTNNIFDGQICYAININNPNYIYLCTYCNGLLSNGSPEYRMYDIKQYSTNQNVQAVNITINSTNIKNETVINEGDNIEINNNGDTIINPDSGGGGGGGDDPVLPSPDYNPAEDWDIDLPDLTVPNWILSGKENKFPFDIPFNVMYALSLLQAEPEAPRLEGTLDFGFYEWDYDLDLSDFDSVAEICRNMEVLAFITGLMLMTRKLIWG